MSATVEPIRGNNGGRRRLTRDQRRKMLLEEATKIFSRRGYHNVSMDDIAEQAGISKALLYQHFESKEQLYLAVLRVHQLRIRDIVTVAWDARVPASERLWRAISAFFRFVEQNRTAWGVLYRDAVAIDGKITRGVHAMRTETAERVAALLDAAGREGGTPKRLSQRSSVVAHALVGTCEALADYWVEHPEETRDSLARTAMSLLWFGYRGMLEGEGWSPPEGDALE